MLADSKSDAIDYRNRVVSESESQLKISEFRSVLRIYRFIISMNLKPLHHSINFEFTLF